MPGCAAVRDHLQITNRIKIAVGEPFDVGEFKRLIGLRREHKWQAA
jgi:hypothetical protein